MAGTDATLEARIAAYIASVLPAAEDVEVAGLDRIFGGASRETYRFVLRYREAGEAVKRRLILRRDPPGSLIETERAVEFAAYRAFHGTEVPVPEPLWLEEDSRWLDHPFFIMEELAGLESSPQAITASPYAEHAEKLAAQKWGILAKISVADPQALGLETVMEPVEPSACADRELGYWERLIDRDEMAPQPVARAAIRWLRRYPPAPAQRVSVVHADYRTGNFLYDTDGNVRAILDWEMAHLGDPLEDLAWGLNPVWRFGTADRAGGLVPREEAVRIWEAESGLHADPAALRWWEVFSSVKGQAIWISSGQQFTHGKNQDPVLALAAWLMGNSQDRAILSLLGELS